MNKEEIRKLAEKDFEEISPVAYYKRKEEGDIKIHHSNETRCLYFKPKERFPKIFELGDDIRAQVLESGVIHIESKELLFELDTSISINEFRKALDEAEKILEKKK